MPWNHSGEPDRYTPHLLRGMMLQLVNPESLLRSAQHLGGLPGLERGEETPGGLETLSPLPHWLLCRRRYSRWRYWTTFRFQHLPLFIPESPPSNSFRASDFPTPPPPPSPPPPAPDYERPWISQTPLDPRPQTSRILDPPGPLTLEKLDTQI